MSTSCLYGFVKDKDLKLAYNNSDSYTDEFGKMIVVFLRTFTLNCSEKLLTFFIKFRLIIIENETPCGGNIS